MPWSILKFVHRSAQSICVIMYEKKWAYRKRRAFFLFLLGEIQTSEESIPVRGLFFCRNLV
nr:MAG TPA: hypothetical protein [Caudoviricetes sp.]